MNVQKSLNILPTPLSVSSSSSLDFSFRSLWAQPDLEAQSLTSAILACALTDSAIARTFRRHIKNRQFLCRSLWHRRKSGIQTDFTSPAAHRTSVSIRRWKEPNLAELVAWKVTNSKEGSMNSQATLREDLFPTSGQVCKEATSPRCTTSETRQQQMDRTDSGNRNCWQGEPQHLRL